MAASETSEISEIQPAPFDQTRLYKSIAGWAAFGVAARAWQLAILRKPLRTAPQVYAYSAVGWGAVGYGAYFFQRRVKYLLQVKKHEIQAKTQEEESRLSAKSIGNALPEAA